MHALGKKGMESKMEQRYRVYFIHYQIQNLKQMTEYLCIQDQKLTDKMVWDSENPDYVFVSENIYRIKEQFLQFRKYKQRKDRIFIASMGEALSADMNLFDYAITYEKNFMVSDRTSRIPPVYIFKNRVPFEQNQLTREDAAALLKAKEKFCNFIYSNPDAHQRRDEIFWELSKYKRVDSLGAHLNNTNVRPTRTDKGWCEISVQLKIRYKFSIACENAVQNGYSSEKIISSFAAHTVPVYFGDPLIAEEYNPKAFINAGKYQNLEDLRKQVHRVDENDDLWMDMISQPWQTSEQIQKIETEMEQYQDFIRHIFIQNLQSAKRITAGTHHDIYENWFWKRFSYTDRFKKKIKQLKSR